MSWQATAWVLDQNVGHSGRKLLLLATANYADEHGFCWPSQQTLGKHAEMSLDTVQRQTKKLVAQGLISITRAPKRRGQWQTFRYQLNMSDKVAGPQNAARRPGTKNSDDRGCQADMGGCQQELTPHGVEGPPEGNCGSAMSHPERKPGRTAMRLNPSIEPSRAKTSSDAAERLKAFQAKQEPIEVTQDRIAKRLGGWDLLMRMTDRELERITALERRRRLDDETLNQAVLGLQLVHPP